MGTVLLTLLTQVAAIHALLTTSAFLTVAALPAIGRCAAMITCARGFTAFSPTGFGALVIGTIRWWWIGVWALMLAAVLRGVDTRHYRSGGNASVQPACRGAFSAAFRRT